LSAPIAPIGGRTDPVAPTAMGAVGGRPDGSARSHVDVELIGITKKFGEVTAVDSMDLQVASGAFYSFLGPSGCGKTTTLRMIAGFEQPTEGTILLDGEEVAGVPPYRRNVNTVFQHYALFPHMDVAQNVGYGLRQKKIGKDEERRRVDETLELVRLTGYSRRRTWEMSGGQQQRVALARALVNHPTVLLLDEPLGALDRKLRHEMQLELKDLQQRVGITFIYVTHDQEEALTMSDVIVVMKDGRIQQQGGPEELYRVPVNRFVADFIGTSNFVDARIVSMSGRSRAQIETTSGLRTWGVVTDPEAAPQTGAAVSMAIRPESLRIEEVSGGDRTENGWVRIPGRVKQGTYLGDTTEYRIATDAIGDEVIVRRQTESTDTAIRIFGPGEAVVLAWHEDANLVLTS